MCVLISKCHFLLFKTLYCVTLLSHFILDSSLWQLCKETLRREYAECVWNLVFYNIAHIARVTTEATDRAKEAEERECHSWASALSPHHGGEDSKILVRKRISFLLGRLSLRHF